MIRCTLEILSYQFFHSKTPAIFSPSKKSCRSINYQYRQLATQLGIWGLSLQACFQSKPFQIKRDKGRWILAIRLVSAEQFGMAVFPMTMELREWSMWLENRKKLSAAAATINSRAAISSALLLVIYCLFASHPKKTCVERSSFGANMAILPQVTCFHSLFPPGCTSAGKNTFFQGSVIFLPGSRVIATRTGL